jgi:hypothetical protein
MLRRLTMFGLITLSAWCYAQSLVDTRLTYDTVIWIPRKIRCRFR